MNVTPNRNPRCCWWKRGFKRSSIERRQTWHRGEAFIEGEVTRVLPGIQSRFEDIGAESRIFMPACSDIVSHTECVDVNEQSNPEQKHF